MEVWTAQLITPSICADSLYGPVGGLVAFEKARASLDRREGVGTCRNRAKGVPRKDRLRDYFVLEREGDAATIKARKQAFFFQ
jgi:hypothetical protein